jgi:hypothetical protein
MAGEMVKWDIWGIFQRPQSKSLTGKRFGGILGGSISILDLSSLIDELTP